MSQVCTSTSTGGVECETKKNQYSVQVMIGAALFLLLLVAFVVNSVKKQ